MNRKKSALIPLFHESFTTETDGLPGGWHVEQNTDMPDVPAIRRGEACVELLSAGNKFLPIIPDTSDFQADITMRINYDSAQQFAFLICFRYDMESGRGQAIRISNPRQAAELSVEYGTMRLNEFTAKEGKTFKVRRSLFSGPIRTFLSAEGTGITVSLLGVKADFTIAKGKGKLAVAREHFWDVLKITACEILGEKPRSAGKDVSFTVPMPDSLTYYPIFCDVTLRDYGNCMDAMLSFRGGVAETPAGEGNYHAMRADIIEQPYLKILTRDRQERHVVYDKEIAMVPPGMAPSYFYGTIYRKVDWPFKRTVRFVKPSVPFDLAAGFGLWHHNASPDQELAPAETVFDSRGRVLYSGLGIVSGENRKIEFFSQEKKEILKKLPKNDPRYDRAVKFAERNHYFFEKEVPQFRIRISSALPLPDVCRVTLEDAFLRPVRELECAMSFRTESIGVSSVNISEIAVEPLPGLACGVYHLRVRSADPSVPVMEDYCAFEIMSRKKGALPPPRLSGFPFLYNARTETRGLMTDAFDPWLNAGSVNEGHYISCTVMLPAAYRKYNMAPVIHAYGRENFAWISSRTLDKPAVEDNLDVIRDSDYANAGDCNERMSTTWAYSYYGARLRTLIRFLETKNDPDFDLDAMRALAEKEEKKSVSPDVIRLLAEKYWEEWLDFNSRASEKWVANMLKKLRKVNPKIKLAQYGPYHIYAAALKSCEALRMLGNDRLTPDLIHFWQYEDYPSSCGYGLERGLFFLTSSLMTIPGARIYPEVYTGGKLRQGCPDGAVFFAHPPFGIRARPHRTTYFQRQIANFVYGSGYLTDEGFRFWTERGFQACRFTRPWYEALMEVWPTVLKHEPLRPLKSAAYVFSEAGRKTPVMIGTTPYNIFDVRHTAFEDVPFAYECAFKAGICAGFQLTDEKLRSLSPDQTDILVLPPLRGMKPDIIRRIRALHAKGVHLLTFENADGLEDLFGVCDTGKMKKVTRIAGRSGFCPGLTEMCDDDRCRGSWAADGAEVLLEAEIPVLTLKKNKKACAAFFNVPPQLVRAARLRNKPLYGKTGISVLMEKAVQELMRSLSGSPVRASAGNLLGCRTKDGGTLIIVENPEDYRDMTAEITIRKEPGLRGEPELNMDVMLLREDRKERVYRAYLSPGKTLFMYFR